MGIAAYNRGSQVIANQIACDYPMKSQEVQIIERINGLPKYMGSLECRGKHEPFFDVGVIYPDLGGWMFADYDDPYGEVRFYKSLEDTVRSWDIYLLEYKVVQGKPMWVTVNESGLDEVQKLIDRLN